MKFLDPDPKIDRGSVELKGGKFRTPPKNGRNRKEESWVLNSDVTLLAKKTQAHEKSMALGFFKHLGVGGYLDPRNRPKLPFEEVFGRLGWCIWLHFSF